MDILNALYNLYTNETNIPNASYKSFTITIGVPNTSYLNLIRMDISNVSYIP